MKTIAITDDQQDYTIADADVKDGLFIAICGLSESRITFPKAEENLGREVVLKLIGTVSSTLLPDASGPNQNYIEGAASLEITTTTRLVAALDDGGFPSWYRV